MRALIRSLPRPTTVVDFEEAMLIPAMRGRTRLWRLAQALVAARMQVLHAREVTAVTLGTSSENQAMQRLAESLGFGLVSEMLWFSKKID